MNSRHENYKILITGRVKGNGSKLIGTKMIERVYSEYISITPLIA